jgi:SAM-dependent methyltransferase
MAGIDAPRSSKKRSSSSPSASGFTTLGSDPSTNIYETQSSVFEYLLMHYGTEKELMNFPALQQQQMKESMNFPRECAEVCGKYAAKFSAPSSSLRALDIGCSVGRSSFEMTRFASEVVGLDYSQAFVDAANEIKKVSERGSKGCLHALFRSVFTFCSCSVS